MEIYNSVKIMGNGTISEGEFDKVTIMGDAVGQGQFKCNAFKVMGSCHLKENITALDGKISGDTSIDKDFDVTGQLKVMGELNCSGNGKVNRFVILGESDIKGNLKAIDIIVKGELKVDKDCESTTVDSKGKINVNGLLSADKINIDPRDKCYINEIGGSEVIIQKSNSLFSFKHGKVISKVIEADKIILENTECDIVRGKDITILNGCSIGRVEYSGTLTVSKGSKVREEVCQKN